MAWSEIIARVGEPFTAFLKDLKRQQQQYLASQNQVTEPDKIAYVRSVDSLVTLRDDKLLAGKARPKGVNHYYIGMEPDNKYVAYWNKFDSGGYLKDHSKFKHKTTLKLKTRFPQMYFGYDDGIQPSKVISVLDGVEHYYQVEDSDRISLQKMEQQGFTSFCVRFELYPVYTVGESVSEGKYRASLFAKIDNDQVSHAYRAEIDDEGICYFYIRFNHVDYMVKTATSMFNFIDPTDYFESDYNDEDYMTSDEDLEILPDNIIFKDLKFQFDFVTKKISIWSDTTEVVTNPVLQQGAVPQEAFLTMWLPLSEGNGEKGNDISGFNNNVSWSANAAINKPFWQVDNGRKNLHFGSNDNAVVPNSTSLNTVTSFTASMFMYAESDYRDPSTTWKLIIAKDPAFGAGGWRLFGHQANSGNLNFEIKSNASVVSTINASNVIPTADQLYHIVLTYDGSNMRIYVNKTLAGTTAVAGLTLVNAGGMILGTTTTDWTARMRLHHVMFWKGAALNQTEINTLYEILKPTVDPIPQDYVADDKPPFPIYWDNPPAPPAPGQPYTQPMDKIYDLVGDIWKKVYKVTVSDLTSVYNVALGTPTTDPVNLFYDISPGTGTTLPFTPVYTQNGVSSEETLSNAGGDAIRHAAKVENTSSSIYDKTITKIGVWMYNDGGSGNITAGIRKGSDDSFISFGTKTAASIPQGAFGAIQEFTLTTNTYKLVVGDFVTVEYSGAPGVQVARSSTLNDANSKRFYYDTSWHSTGTNYNMSFVISTGGTGSTPSYQLKSASTFQYTCAEYFPTGSAAIGKTITKAEFRVWRENVAAAGTVSIRHIKADGTYWPTLYEVNVSTLPTAEPSDFNFIWNDVTYPNPIAAGDRFGIVLSASTGAFVYVQSNTGITDPYDTNKSYLVTRNFAGGGWNTATAIDVSGKLSTGGNDFTPYVKLDHSRKRTGIKIQAGSSLIGKKMSKLTITAQGDGTPAIGAVYVKIRKANGDIQVHFGQRDSSEVLGTDTTLEFLNTDNNYAFLATDVISIEYENGTASDYIKIGCNKNQFETTMTIMFETPPSSNVQTIMTDRDLAGQVHTGGVLDTAARPKIGIILQNPTSSLVGKSITKTEFYLKRTQGTGGFFTGTDKLFVRIVRGTDKVTIATIGEVLITSIPTTETLMPFTNTNNSYVMKDDDLIVIDCNFGNPLNYVEVKVTSLNQKDGADTCFFDYNGLTYAAFSDNDVAGKLHIGGFTVYPDPAVPIPVPPFHYSTDLYINACYPLDSEALVEPTTIDPPYGSMLYSANNDFRIYRRKLTLDEITNLYTNKKTIAPIAFGETELIGYDEVHQH